MELKKLVTSVRTQLATIFNVREWSPTQHDTYKWLKQLVQQFSTTEQLFESKDDKVIIRNNLKDEMWYNCSKSKPIIGQLLDSMSLQHYTYDHHEDCLSLSLVMKFNYFALHSELYQNYTDQLTHTYIYVENPQHQRAYITFYTKFPGTEMPSNLKLPDFDKIYQVTNLSQTIMYQSDLLNFLSEITMYYDDSGILGDLPIGNGINVTLNQLINKFNMYLTQKKEEVDYQIK